MNLNYGHVVMSHYATLRYVTLRRKCDEKWMWEMGKFTWRNTI